ncbi:AAA family ATPase [Streptomyces sp. NPDC059639]|uniref:AAA family ATPase n=1 Tax=Streptomyces sp. NPDC059639 TaxID=3346891 RepID=UPI0036C7BFDB
MPPATSPGAGRAALSARRRAPACPRPDRAAPPAPRHDLRLADAGTVWLPVFEALSRGLEQTIDQQAIMCLSGDAGVGKTFALATVLVADTTPACRVCLARLVPRPAPTPAALRCDLAAALDVRDVSHKDPEAFDAALRDVLAAREHLFVVDEAQRLDAACFEYLRYFLDDPRTCAALVLVVGERGLAVLRRQKMLASRTAVSLRIPALTPGEVRWAIPRFHPLWQTSTPEAVDLLDARLCHGNFRRWAQATHHTLRLLRSRGEGAGHQVLQDLLHDRLPPHHDTRRPSATVPGTAP